MRHAVLGSVPFILLFAACGDGGGAAEGGGATLVSEHAGITLIATTTRAAGLLTTKVTHDGVLKLTMTLDADHLALDFPVEGPVVAASFQAPLADLPTDRGANLLATYIVAEQQTLTGDVLPDAPGCDWFPDTQCTLGCCAQHDRCYAENGCGASSWLPGFGSEACKNCNAVAAECIIAACGDATSTSAGDRCYDNRCRQFYDCGAAHCDCASPCDTTTPATCGNGSCEVLETVENCHADCAQGDGTNQCCVATQGCPSETQESCPGDCCCCGYGEVCNAASELCAPSR